MAGVIVAQAGPLKGIGFTQGIVILKRGRLAVISSVLLVMISFCNKNSGSPEDDASTNIDATNIEGIYVIKGEPDQGLYYTEYNTIEFEQLIENDRDDPFWTLYLNKENNLLIGATQEKLYFLNTATNQQIGELSIPNNINTSLNIRSAKDMTDRPAGRVRVFPYYMNSDHCILVNRSVYLVDLKELIIEKLIWDSETYDNREIYIDDLALSEDSKFLYLQLFLDSGLGFDQRLTKLNLETGQMNTIYDYHEDGSYYVFCSRDYIFSYDPNNDYILRFSASSETLIDSFIVTQADFLSSPQLNGDHIIVQDLGTGNFYWLYPETKRLELYMQIPFHLQGIIWTSYQKLMEGDLYACIPHTSEGKSLIVNLSQKQVERELEWSSINFIILKGKDE